jgi:hypothetical protein
MCDRVPMPGGGVAIVCGGRHRRRPPCVHCGDASAFACDGPAPSERRRDLRPPALSPMPDPCAPGPGLLPGPSDSGEGGGRAAPAVRRRRIIRACEVRTETVAESFATYRTGVIPAGASDVQVEECRRAFYAGTYFMLLNLLHNIGDDSTDEDQGVVELEKLKAECEAFAAGVKMALPTATPPPPVVPDVNYTTPDAAAFRPVLEDLGQKIGAAVPNGWGFNLMLFQFNGGSLFYIANADRADVLNIMREYIQRNTQ